MSGIICWKRLERVGKNVIGLITVKQEMVSEIVLASIKQTIIVLSFVKMLEDQNSFGIK